MEWPIDRQERDSQKCPTQIINRRRSIGSREKKREEESGQQRKHTGQEARHPSERYQKQ